jgi:RND family efflux transporter MFP subunit
MALAMAAVILAAAGSWMYLSRGMEVHTVTVNRVSPSQLLAKLNASGYVVAQRKADVAVKITGQLVSLMVSEGSVVKEGQVLARLENDDVQALVDQNRANVVLAEARAREARANLEDAERHFTRMRKLVTTGAVSRSDFDTAEARAKASRAAMNASAAALKASRAALRSSEVSLSYTEIRAPFDAVVLTKNADVGDIVTPLGAASTAKAAVVSIADLSSLQVEADVSEGNIGQVSPGQPCEITLDALPGERFPGVVNTIVPTVDRSKATVMVKVRFMESDPRVLPEMSAKCGGSLEKAVTADEQQARDHGEQFRRCGNGRRFASVFLARVGQGGEDPRKPWQGLRGHGGDPLGRQARGCRCLPGPGQDKGRNEGHGPREVIMDGGANIVEIRRVFKSYHRGDIVVPVLADISFDIPGGEYLSIMGPSGSGKSTLLNLIAGIDSVDRGSITVAGEEITALTENELALWRSGNVGFIFQFYNPHSRSDRLRERGASPAPDLPEQEARGSSTWKRHWPW